MTTVHPLSEKDMLQKKKLDAQYQPEIYYQAVPIQPATAPNIPSSPPLPSPASNVYASSSRPCGSSQGCSTPSSSSCCSSSSSKSGSWAATAKAEYKRAKAMYKQQKREARSNEHDAKKHQHALKSQLKEITSGVKDAAKATVQTTKQLVQTHYDSHIGDRIGYHYGDLQRRIDAMSSSSCEKQQQQQQYITAQALQHDVQARQLHADSIAQAHATAGSHRAYWREERLLLKEEYRLHKREYRAQKRLNKYHRRHGCCHTSNGQYSHPVRYTLPGLIRFAISKGVQALQEEVRHHGHGRPAQPIQPAQPSVVPVSPYQPPLHPPVVPMATPVPVVPTTIPTTPTKDKDYAQAEPVLVYAMSNMTLGSSTASPSAPPATSASASAPATSTSIASAPVVAPHSPRVEDDYDNEYEDTVPPPSYEATVATNAPSTPRH
ncbi:hypothetical protein BGW42_000890 [Actinomortierella wolfii]|nr:hypothetical protein BGW42_000890 [Actinomortierella wolfii]